MVRWFTTGVVMAFGMSVTWGLVPGSALGQTVERDTTVTGPRGATRSTETVRGPGVFDRSSTVTGPRGNSVTRSFDSVRGPDGLNRQATVTGPRGGSITRDLSISRSVIPGGGPGFRPGGWGPPRYGPPVFVGGGGGGNGLVNFGIGAGLGTGVGLLLGSALAPRPVPVPPPTVLVTAPAIVASPGFVVAQPPPTVVVNNSGFDPVADAVGRLKSWHENSRRDGCVTLGRLHDPRAVPALVDRLKNDGSREVRIAAATAIGEIGDPQTAVVLERATIYDKKQEVRDAAAAALTRIPKVTASSATVRSVPTAGPMPGGRGTLPTPPPPAPPAINSSPGLQPLPGGEELPPSPTPILPDPNYRPRS